MAILEQDRCRVAEILAGFAVDDDLSIGFVGQVDEGDTVVSAWGRHGFTRVWVVQATNRGDLGYIAPKDPIRTMTARLRHA